MIEIEICLFNSLARYAPQGAPFHLNLPAGSRAADVPTTLKIPPREIFVVWRNGRNITTSFGGEVERDVTLEHGDRLALSGPIPFSRAYGAPVC
jgi:hypothetical protein